MRTQAIVKTPRLKSLLAKLAVGVLFLLPARSMAWGLLGHRIVAEIADSYLTPKARVEIKKILGNESMASVSNWADFVKSDPAYRYLSPWHYADFGPITDYAAFRSVLASDTATDVYTKMNFLVSELKKKTLPAAKKNEYLKLLIHFAGDIHQPLHVSPEGTEGGNAVKVNWFGKASNLHTIWDSELINYHMLSFTEYTKWINFTTAAQRAQWQREDLGKWLFDSFRLSEKIIAGVKPEANLSYKYIFDYTDTVNAQLLKGGVHLAGLLNAIFG